MPLKTISAQLLELQSLSLGIKDALASQNGNGTRGNALEDLTRLAASLEKLSRVADEQHQLLQQLHALTSVGRAVNSSLALTMVLKEVMDMIIALTGAEHSFLMLRNSQGDLEIRIARNIDPLARSLSEFEVSYTLASRVAETGETILTTNAQEDPRFDKQESVVAFQLCSILCVPLKVKGVVIGVIYADHRMQSGVFKKHDSDLLMAFADQAAIAIDNARLFEDLKRSKNDVEMAYDATLEGWGLALDLRDKETEGHTKRVADLTVRLAKLMGFKDDELIQVRRGALLHDIGKIGIPDNILNKPGQLTPEELVTMRRHPTLAYEMLWPIAYLRPALSIPYCHHERWDGTGYPRGLRSTQIPLEARAFAIVDVWDALTSKRPYREAWPPEKVCTYVMECSGNHFDPEVVDTFLKLILGEMKVLQENQ